MPPASPSTIAEWKQLYGATLPTAARERSYPGADSPATRWPVQLDHCFARIILDHVVGKSYEGLKADGKPWTQVIKSPAIKSMTEEQARECIRVGQAVLDGDMDLNQMDAKSLEVRGKAPKKSKAAGQETTGKRKLETQSSPLQSKRVKQENVVDLTKEVDDDKPVQPIRESPPNDPTGPAKSNPTGNPVLQLIDDDDSLTPFRKSVLRLICLIPRGRYTTYAAIASHLSSSARAVGNALRNNPYAGAPSLEDEQAHRSKYAPCHRILAADGSIGGFGGQWGKETENGKLKKQLLRAEGVRFDVKGKVIGGPYRFGNK